MVETSPSLIEERHGVLHLVLGDPELTWFFGKPDLIQTT